MTLEEISKINRLKSNLPDMSFEIFKDGILVLNHITKMGVKVKRADLALPIKDIIRHINANTHLVN